MPILSLTRHSHLTKKRSQTDMKSSKNQADRSVKRRGAVFNRFQVDSHNKQYETDESTDTNLIAMSRDQFLDELEIAATIRLNVDECASHYEDDDDDDDGENSRPIKPMRQCLVEAGIPEHLAWHPIFHSYVQELCEAWSRDATVFANTPVAIVDSDDDQDVDDSNAVHDSSIWNGPPHESHLLFSCHESSAKTSSSSSSLSKNSNFSPDNEFDAQIDEIFESNKDDFALQAAMEWIEKNQYF